jgi:hypothetical protein
MRKASILLILLFFGIGIGFWSRTFFGNSNHFLEPLDQLLLRCQVEEPSKQEAGVVRQDTVLFYNRDYVIWCRSRSSANGLNPHIAANSVYVFDRKKIILHIECDGTNSLRYSPIARQLKDGTIAILSYTLNGYSGSTMHGQCRVFVIANGIATKAFESDFVALDQTQSTLPKLSFYTFSNSLDGTAVLMALTETWQISPENTVKITNINGELKAIWHYDKEMFLSPHDPPSTSSDDVP